MRQRLVHVRVPDITDPLGRHWRQPDSSEMIVTTKQAVMTKGAFDTLYEYSCSLPTGVYEGKMWKAQFQDQNWYLMWFDYSESPEKCSIRHLPITIYERK